MGFSVSGAAALVFAALLVSFGAWFTASANSFERVHEATEHRSDSVVRSQNAALNVTQTSYDAVADELTVTVENTGAAQFTLSGTDVLVDGDYVAGWQDGAAVAGGARTDLWLAGEVVTLTVNASSRPEQVKVVAAEGVADTREVPA